MRQGRNRIVWVVVGLVLAIVVVGGGLAWLIDWAQQGDQAMDSMLDGLKGGRSRSGQ